MNPFVYFSSGYDTYGEELEGSIHTENRTRASNALTFSALLDRHSNSQRKELRYREESARIEPELTELQALVNKYERQAGTAAQLRSYDSLASKHKEALLKEATDMQTKFSENLQLAMRMEGTVTQISELLTEFASILQAQGDQVGDVHDDAKQAEDHVKASKSQLHLTLEHSQKNQKSIVFLALGLALLLLLLDWIER